MAKVYDNGVGVSIVPLGINVQSTNSILSLNMNSSPVIASFCNVTNFGSGRIMAAS